MVVSDVSLRRDPFPLSKIHSWLQIVLHGTGHTSDNCKVHIKE
jgi:hypothetical protein